VTLSQPPQGRSGEVDYSFYRWRGRDNGTVFFGGVSVDYSFYRWRGRDAISAGILSQAMVDYSFYRWRGRDTTTNTNIIVFIVSLIILSTGGGVVT